MLSAWFKHDGASGGRDQHEQQSSSSSSMMDVQLVITILITNTTEVLSLRLCGSDNKEPIKKGAVMRTIRVWRTARPPQSGTINPAEQIKNAHSYPQKHRDKATKMGSDEI